MIWEKFGTFNEDIVSNLLIHDISILGSLVGFELKNIKIIKNLSNFTRNDIFRTEFKIDNIYCDIIINRCFPINQKTISIEVEDGHAYHWIGEKVYEVSHINKNNKLLFKNDQNTLEIVCKNFISLIQNKPQKYTSDINFGFNVINLIEKFALKNK